MTQIVVDKRARILYVDRNIYFDHINRVQTAPKSFANETTVVTGVGYVNDAILMRLYRNLITTNNTERADDLVYEWWCCHQSRIHSEAEYLAVFGDRVWSLTHDTVIEYGCYDAPLYVTGEYSHIDMWNEENPEKVIEELKAAYNAQRKPFNLEQPLVFDKMKY